MIRTERESLRTRHCRPIGHDGSGVVQIARDALWRTSFCSDPRGQQIAVGKPEQAVAREVDGCGQLIRRGVQVPQLAVLSGEEGQPRTVELQTARGSHVVEDSSYLSCGVDVIDLRLAG